MTRLADGPTIGIHVPGAARDGLADAGRYREFFAACEQLGFDALWTEDRILHPAHIADPMLLATWAAAHTREILIGTAVLLLNLRSAPAVARQVATLQHLAGDRLALGVSLGGQPGEYSALGINMDKRVSRFEESLAVLRGLLSGDPFEHRGDHFELSDAVVRPAANVPILIGGIAPAAQARAGRLGDGWIMGPFGQLADFRAGLSTVRLAAEQAGRDADQLAIGRLLYVAVDDDSKRAHDALATFLHGYYGPGFDVESQAIFGPAAAVAERLHAQAEAGVQHLMLGVPEVDPVQLQRLADGLLPVLRGN